MGALVQELDSQASARLLLLRRAAIIAASRRDVLRHAVFLLSYRCHMPALRSSRAHIPPVLVLPQDIEPFVIGLWRFREVGRPRRWCATYCYRGMYYDVAGCLTLDETVIAVRAGLSRLRRAHSPRRSQG